MKRSLLWMKFAFAMLSVAFLLLGPGANAQEKRLITGTVRDTAGLPVPGVTIRIKGAATGSGKGAISDDAGAFAIHAAAGDVLVFSSIGFVTNEATVGGSGVVSVQLYKNSSALGEVVVTGFGGRTNTRKLSYSVTEVKGSDIVATNNSNLGDALQGKVAGVTISQGTGGPSSSSRIQIRGNARLAGNTEPLVVLDGILIQPSTTGADSWGTGADFGNIIKDLNPDDYESVTVLKGSAASALYGSQALNGVLIITTKKGRARKGLGVNFNQTISFDKPYKMLDLQNEFGGGLSPTFTNNTVDNSATPYNNPNGGYSYGPAFQGQTVKDIDGRTITWKPNDPVKDFFVTGQFKNTNVAVEGGNESSTFRASWTNLWNTSVMPNNSLNKNSFTMRATHRLSGVISLDASINYTNVKIINPIQQGGGGDIQSIGGQGNPVQDFVYLAPRSADIAYYNHNYIDPVNGGIKAGIAKDPYLLAASIWPIYQDNSNRIENVLFANLDVNLHFTSWLTGLVRGNVQNYNDQTQYMYNGVSAGFTGGSYELIQSAYRNTRFQGLLSANKNFGKDFVVTGSIGGESFQQLGGNISDAKTVGGLQVPSHYFISNSVSSPTITQTYNPTYRYNAVYAYGDVTWRNMLTFNFSVRNDWTSSLTYADGHGDWTYAYPAFGLAWVFTELPSFEHSNSILSYGKLRASVGWTGYPADPYVTNSTGNYGYVGTYNNPSNSNQQLYSFADGQGNYNTTLGNQHLKNELAREIEFGADLRFFNNRLGLDAAWYKKNSFNQIIPLSADIESGIPSRTINAGNIQNEGIELLLTATPVRTKSFNWDMTVNFTRNRNKVIELYPGVQNYQLQLAFGADVAAYAIAGSTYGTVITGYGYAKYAGKNSQANGQRVIGNAAYGTTGGYLTFMRASDYQPGGQDTLGNIMPDFLWGTIQTFTYKNFVFSFQLDSKVGGLMASATDQYGSETGSLKNSLYGRNTAHGGIAFTDGSGNSRNDGIIPKGVIADGTVVNGTDLGGMTYQDAVNAKLLTPIPAYAYYENLYQWSSGIRAESIFDNSWIAVRQVSLGYNLPATLIKPLHINGLRLTVTGRNLFYIWKTAKDGINPEGLYNNQASAFAEGGGLPFIRSYGATLNASF
ncbi:MAG TPA: SusC/RagA family TonB-linked outer membrane protein [Puia sp.]|jgi:iron complex outermembrane receptor protein|nr:SusC/RagA family TonB-linked outer membrane protein [Puia sp.]